jgi:hypothetical protein
MEINGRGNPLRWPRDTLYPQKLALTSPTCGGRSVSVVRLRTKATEFSLYESQASRGSKQTRAPYGSEGEGMNFLHNVGTNTSRTRDVFGLVITAAWSGLTLLCSLPTGLTNLLAQEFFWTMNECHFYQWVLMQHCLTDDAPSWNARKKVDRFAIAYTSFFCVRCPL